RAARSRARRGPPPRCGPRRARPADSRASASWSCRSPRRPRGTRTRPVRRRARRRRARAPWRSASRGPAAESRAPEYPRRMPLAGALYAALAYGTWGVLPIYWKALAGVPLLEVLSHRVFGTVIFSALSLAVLGRYGRLREALRSRRERLTLLAS